MDKTRKCLSWFLFRIGKNGFINCSCIRKLQCSIRTNELFFKDSAAVQRLTRIHDKCVVVPADKASNNIVFVCKTHNYDCLMKQPNMHVIILHSHFQSSWDKILDNRKSVIESIVFKTGKNDVNLPLYWIPRSH
jgi:hypothetical protein